MAPSDREQPDGQGADRQFHHNNPFVLFKRFADQQFSALLGQSSGEKHAATGPAPSLEPLTDDQREWVGSIFDREEDWPYATPELSQRECPYLRAEERQKAPYSPFPRLLLGSLIHEKPQNYCTQSERECAEPWRSEPSDGPFSMSNCPELRRRKEDRNLFYLLTHGLPDLADSDCVQGIPSREPAKHSTKTSSSLPTVHDNSLGSEESTDDDGELNEAATELDLFEESFQSPKKMPIRPFSEAQKLDGAKRSMSDPAQADPSLISTLTRTERIVLPDGSARTISMLKKRFADGHEEDTVTEHTQKQAVEKPRVIEPDPFERPFEGGRKRSEGKRGWFWNQG